LTLSKEQSLIFSHKESLNWHQEAMTNSYHELRK